MASVSSSCLATSTMPKLLKKILVKDEYGQRVTSSEIEQAKATLDVRGMDRFWRALKVWFVRDTKQFEFEDRAT